MTRRIVCLVLPLFVLLGLMLPGAAHAQAINKAWNSEKVDVLVVTTYSSFYRWSSLLTEQILRHVVIDKGKKASAINIPLLEMGSKEEFVAATEEYGRELKDNRPGCVVLVGSGSFVLCDCLNKLFPDIPMVLIGGQNYTGTVEQMLNKEVVNPDSAITMAELRKKYNAVSFYDPVYLKEQLDLMLKLMPELENIYFVGGDDHFSRNRERELSQLIARCGRNIKLQTILSGEMGSDMALVQLEGLDEKKDAVLYSSWSSQKMIRESPMMMNNFVWMLDLTPSPVFTLRDNGWIKDSKTFVGGYFVKDEDLVKSLCQALDEIMDGKPARSIADYVAKPMVHVNHNAMEKYGMDMSEISDDAVVYNAPVSFWVQYEKSIIAVLLFVMLIIVMLLYRVYFHARETVKEQRKTLAVSNKYDKLIANSPFGVCVAKLLFDADGNVDDICATELNPRIQQVFDERGLKLGTTVKQAFPLSHKDYIGPIRDAYAQKKPYVLYPFHMAEADIHYEHLVFFDEHNEIRILSFDRTGLVKMTQKAREAEDKQKWFAERFNMFLDEAPFGSTIFEMVFDDDKNVVDTTILDINAFVKNDVAGYDGPIVGRRSSELFPKSYDKYVGPINEAHKKGERFAKFDYELEELGLMYFIVVFFDFDKDHPNTARMFSFNRTELHNTRIKLQAALDEAEKARAEAERADKLKTQFVQNMSHEIRTPLNAVVGFSQLLSLPEDVVSAEEREEYCEYISNCSQMLMMLVDDILDIADVESNRYRIELSDFEPNAVCRAAMKTAEYRLQSGVELKFTTDVADDFRMHSDPRRVQQVLINYLTNACKHTKQGSIEVGCSSTANPGHITFSVTDTGTGVPPEMAEDIFERFRKLDVFAQGAGLGLNICRTIADKLGGKVMLDTTYTQGARFIFVL